MITERNLNAALTLEIPEIRQDLDETGNSTCVYKTAAFFAAFTKRMIRDQRWDIVRHCFRIAELLLKKGDYTVKNAMENVYIFSVSNAITLNDQFHEKLPPLFEQIYRKQAHAACI